MQDFVYTIAQMDRQFTAKRLATLFGMKKVAIPEVFMAVPDMLFKTLANQLNAFYAQQPDTRQVDFNNDPFGIQREIADRCEFV